MPEETYIIVEFIVDINGGMDISHIVEEDTGWVMFDTKEEADFYAKAYVDYRYKIICIKEEV